MRPKEVTFRVLKDTLDVARYKMREGIWSENNVQAYCTANGINVLCAQKLIDSVNNLLALGYYRSNDGQKSDPSNAAKVINNFKQFQDKYQLWCGGPFRTVP